MGAALVVPADDGQEVRVRAEDREIAVYLVKYVIAHASKRIRNDQPCRDRTVLAEGVLDLLGGYHLRPVALDHRGRNEAVHGRRWNWTRVGLYGRVRLVSPQGCPIRDEIVERVVQIAFHAIAVSGAVEQVLFRCIELLAILDEVPAFEDRNRGESPTAAAGILVLHRRNHVYHSGNSYKVACKQERTWDRP